MSDDREVDVYSGIYRCSNWDSVGYAWWEQLDKPDGDIHKELTIEINRNHINVMTPEYLYPIRKRLTGIALDSEEISTMQLETDVYKFVVLFKPIATNKIEQEQLPTKIITVSGRHKIMSPRIKHIDIHVQILVEGNTIHCLPLVKVRNWQ